MATKLEIPRRVVVPLYPLRAPEVHSYGLGLKTALESTLTPTERWRFSFVGPTALEGHPSIETVRSFVQLVGELEDSGFDGIVHFPVGNVRLYPVRGARTVATIHELVASDGQRDSGDTVSVPRRIRPFLKQIDRIVAVSQRAARALELIPGVSPDRVRVIPVGVDSARYFPAQPESIARARQSLGLGEDYWVVIVPALDPENQLMSIVRAYAELHKRVGSLPGLALLAQPGLVDPHLHAVLRSSGVEHAVRFVDPLDPAVWRAVVSAARSAIVPCLRGPLGGGALEAIACGTPTITPDHSAFDEYAHPGTLRFDADEPESLIAALSRDRFRLRPVAALDRRFTWDGVVQSVLSLYAELA
ncbi:MAG: glycosyltransferase family 4 protein [Myxococcales bacterium]|nr:glycosyltransferase family 4 protein [Myxococcales bacterium]